MGSHGTYGAYQRCRLTKDGPCEACLAASREYHRARRARVGIEKEKRYQRARNRATTVLIHRHQAEFFQLMRIEIQKEGQ